MASSVPEIIVALDLGATFWKGALYSITSSNHFRAAPEKDLPVIRISRRSAAIPLKSLIVPAPKSTKYYGKTRFASSVSSFVSSLSGSLLSDIDCAVVTGGPSSSLGVSLRTPKRNIPLFYVSEIDAVANSAFSGLRIRNKRVLSVSVGTGTAMVLASRNPSGRVVSRHISGTGLGGGTVVGLGSALAGVSSFSMLEKIASRGHPSNCNLTIGDILGTGMGNLPAEATASNFALLSGGKKHSKRDLASACFSLVAETVGVLSVQASRAERTSKIVFSGTLLKSELFSGALSSVMNLFGATYSFHPHPEFSVLGGALRHFVFSKR